MKETHFTGPDEFEVKVLKVWNEDEKKYVEISPNLFYPDGKGGQLGDRGFVGNAKVLYVWNERIEVDKEISRGTFLAKVDVERRKEVARQHTAQHILSAAAEKLFDVETVGFHMGEDYTTVDFDSDVNLEKIVELSNDVILDDLTVEEMTVSPSEVEKYKLRKVSPKALEAGNIRIIKIGEFDLNACGGFHVSKTGEIGSVRIIHSERVKGGFTRIWFVAGKRALIDCKNRDEVLKRSSKLFDASWKDLEERVKKSLSELKEKNVKVKKLSQELAKFIAGEIKKNDIVEVDEMVASFVTRLRQDVAYVLKISPNSASVCLPIEAKEEVISWAKGNGFKGGGKGPIYRFNFSDFSKFKEAFLSFSQRK